MGKPDFIVIGAMKCGTSTLPSNSTLQRGVFMTTPKEPNFFSNDEVFAQGPDWYAGLFEGAAPGDLKGEASTHYTKLPTYPQTVARMQAALPSLRLVYMIRNPMVRAVSHYIHEWSEGRLGEDAAAAFASCPEIVDYGRYGMQIAPFVEAYGRAAIHLTSLEQIKADPQGEFAAICAHIGMPEGAAWIEDLPAQNVSAERIRKLPLHGLLVDNPVAAALRRALVPKSLRQRIRDSRTIRTRPEIPQALQARMQDVFLEDRARLAEIFPAHPALDLLLPFRRLMTAPPAYPGLAAVAIGRNEGARPHRLSRQPGGARGAAGLCRQRVHRRQPGRRCGARGGSGGAGPVGALHRGAGPQRGARAADAGRAAAPAGAVSRRRLRAGAGLAGDRQRLSGGPCGCRRGLRSPPRDRSPRPRCGTGSSTRNGTRPWARRRPAAAMR